MRLQKYMAMCGVAARRKCEEIIAAGRVAVNGETITQMGTQVEDGDVVTLDGQVVGAANVGQRFTDVRYFWSRPSAVDYNGGGSGGSNKATTNPEHLAGVEQRVQDFLAAHPYLSRAEVPAEMVTASGSGLDPDISPRGAQAQVRRVAEARGLDIATVRHLVDSLTQKSWLGLFGTEKVNVLRLNVALEELNEN